MVPYWGWASSPHSVDVSLHGAAEAVAELEDRAVSRCVVAAAKPPLVLLSGGYDSRSIAFRLRRACPGVTAQALTYGPSDCDDAQIASGLSQQLGFEWNCIQPDLHNASEGIASWAAKLGDLCDNVFATLPGGPAQISPGTGRAFWLGTEAFCTVLPPVTPTPEELRARFGLQSAPPQILTALWLLYGAVSRRALDPATLSETGFFSEKGVTGLRSAWWEVMRQMVPLQRETPDIAFDRISIETRFRIWHINRRLFEQAAVTVTPYHDVDLIEYYIGLPQWIRAERRAHIEANAQSIGEYNHLPFHTGALPTDYLSLVRRQPEILMGMAGVIDGCHDLADFLDIPICKRALKGFEHLDTRWSMALLRVVLATYATRSILHPFNQN